MKRLILAVALVMCLSLTAAMALEFNEIGARPSAMGGAFTAVAQDAVGIFYNPAGLARQKKGMDIQIPFGVNVLSTKDILKEADDIFKRGKNLNVGENMTAGQFTQALDFLKQVNDIDKPGAGVLIQGGGGLAVRWKNWGISVQSGIYAFADPNVDMTNIAFVDSTTLSGASKPIDELDTFARANNAGVGTAVNNTLVTQISSIIQGLGGIYTVGYSNVLANTLVYILETTNYTVDAQTYNVDNSAINTFLPTLIQTAVDVQGGTTPTNSIENNNTSLAFNGLWLTEAALSYGRENIFNLNGLDLGVNLKVMKGTTGYYEQRLKDEDFEAKDIKDNFDKTKKESTTFGVDLGLMYQMTDAGKTKIGLVVKNLNTPKFDQPDSAILAGLGSEIELKPQARIGVSFHPWKRVFVSADYDLTKNETIAKNYKSQVFAAGLELNLLKQEQKKFNIALRGGYKANLAESDEGAILTAGLGFSLLHCQLDISGNMSTKKTQNEDGDKIPQSAGVMATLSLNF